MIYVGGTRRSGSGQRQVCTDLSVVHGHYVPSTPHREEEQLWIYIGYGRTFRGIWHVVNFTTVRRHHDWRLTNLELFAWSLSHTHQVGKWARRVPRSYFQRWSLRDSDGACLDFLWGRMSHFVIHQRNSSEHRRSTSRSAAWRFEGPSVVIVLKGWQIAGEGWVEGSIQKEER